MIRSLIYSITFHSVLVLLTILSLPFMLREPVDLPPIVSVELIQITDKTSIPYAPKARKIIEETKKKEVERLVSEQAPPAAKAKEKPDRIPLPNKMKEEKKIVKKKQNPEEVKPEIRQASEFEKKELVDTNQIAALIDKAKEEEAVEQKKTDKITQSSQKNSFATGLTLSQEDALRAQIFGCWSVPLGLPYDEDLLVRIKLQLKKDGTIMKSEILDHQRMNRPGQKFYKVLAESALRAVRLCQPLKVPPTGYDKWKELQLNFNPTEMLKG
ncbi:cell envelope biogenesis protein TolA [Pelagibacteraceae bacterium]|nr:cell envelope biogenesis protein TolA [Pelagibacteraceae bacterium]